MRKILHYFRYVCYFLLISLFNKLGITLLDLVWCVNTFVLYANVIMGFLQPYIFLFLISHAATFLPNNCAPESYVKKPGGGYNIWFWFKKFVFFSFPLLLIMFSQHQLIFKTCEWLADFFNHIVILDATPVGDQRVPLCLSQRDEKLRKEIISFIGTTIKAIEAQPSSGFSISIAVLVAVNGYSGLIDFFRVLQKFCYNTDFFNQYYIYLIDIVTLLQTPQTMAQFAAKMFDYHITNSTPDHQNQYLTLLHRTLKYVLKMDIDKAQLYDKEVFIKLVQQAFNVGIDLDAKTDNVIKEFAKLLDQIVFP